MLIINNKPSKWKGNEAGDAQGTVLGPPLLLFYLNDLIDGMKSDAWTFTVDISLFVVVNDLQPSLEVLDHHLRLDEAWANE